MRGVGLGVGRWRIAEAECVRAQEGRTSAVAVRDGDVPPGSKAASRMDSIRRNMRGPTGSAGLVSGGGGWQAMPEPPSELEVGGRTGS